MPRGTKSDADLDFLTALERGEVVTQAALTQNVGVSVGLINALLKRAIGKGLVKVRDAPYKRYAYYLTPQGFTEKSRLVAQYLERSLQTFREAREQYGVLFRRLRDLGICKVVLVGGGELAEIAILAAISEEIKLIAIVDPSSKLTWRFGIPVVADLKAVGQVDAAVITDRQTPQQTFEQLRHVLNSGQIFAPDILRITPNRTDLLAAFIVKGDTS